MEKKKKKIRVDFILPVFFPPSREGVIVLRVRIYRVHTQQYKVKRVGTATGKKCRFKEVFKIVRLQKRTHTHTHIRYLPTYQQFEKIENVLLTSTRAFRRAKTFGLCKRFNRRDDLLFLTSREKFTNVYRRLKKKIYI